ncbi:hypothetical protein ACSD7O_25060 [Methylorubrum extorquens]|uniref:hypothetical protein n=1 Tax=Methylorubrum extorquens TaxID=408 RepID=UPI003F609FD6
MAVRILTGDCREVPRFLPDERVHSLVTSPPYFGLRDYGIAGQFGLEDTPTAFMAETIVVFREARRILPKDSTLWLNLGDSFARGGAFGFIRGPKGRSHKNSGRVSCTPSSCASFHTMKAQYLSSLDETSSRKHSGIPKTLSTRSLAPVSDRSTIRHESGFPNLGMILAGLPSLYRIARRCSTMLPPSVLRLRNGRSGEVVFAELMLAEDYNCKSKAWPISIGLEKGGGWPPSGDLSFYSGLHQPGDAGTFKRAFNSVNRLRERLKPIAYPDVVIDSGAFVELKKWGRYRTISSSASHSSTGGEAPSRSTTTCRKSASSKAPGFGIEVTSPTARTVPRSFTAPTVIVTGSPFCTGLGLSLCSVIVEASYRLLLCQRLSLLGDAGFPLSNILLTSFCVGQNESEPHEQVVLSEASKGIFHRFPLSLLALLRPGQCAPLFASDAATARGKRPAQLSLRLRNGRRTSHHPFAALAPNTTEGRTDRA